MLFLFACVSVLTTEYRFEPDTTRNVAILRQNVIYHGRLDTRGEFVERLRVHAGPYSGLAPFEVINHASDRPWPVYDYRSGRLVPGVLTGDVTFLPDPGGVVIPFSEYRYSPWARPIWNLPGRFVPETQALTPPAANDTNDVPPAEMQRLFPPPQVDPSLVPLPPLRPRLHFPRLDAFERVTTGG